MEAFLKSAKEHQGLSDHLAFVGASADESYESAQSHINKRKWSAIPQVWMNADALKSLHVNALPTTYIVDPGGEIVANSKDSDIAKEIVKLLAKMNAS